jgi:hypothetical protein
MLTEKMSAISFMSVLGREITDVAKYGEMWRLGAVFSKYSR